MKNRIRVILFTGKYLAGELIWVSLQSAVFTVTSVYTAQMSQLFYKNIEEIIEMF